MTRVCISIGILLLLLGVSVFSGAWVDRRCTVLISEVDEVQRLQEQGQWQAAAEKAVLLERDWEDFRNKAAVLLKNNKLGDADRVSERIVHLSLSGDSGCIAESAEMRLMIDSLRRGELPLPSSIF